MTRLIVNPGICGFKAEIRAVKEGGKKVSLSVETGCPMVEAMIGEIAALDMMAAFTGHLNNPVYRSAAKHLKHVACPVPSAVLKALEVELGLCLPRAVEMEFISEETD